jgi:hypothetical protein
MTIFALGVGGCLALGLMMQHLLRVSQERNQPAIVREVNRVFGARIDGEARLRYLRRQEGAIAQLTISPLLVGSSRELARDVGQFVWRGSHDSTLLAVEVICEDPLGAGSQRYTVDRPFMPGASAGSASARPAPPKPVAPATSSGAPATPAPGAPTPAPPRTESAPPRPRA